MYTQVEPEPVSIPSFSNAHHCLAFRKTAACCFQSLGSSIAHLAGALGKPVWVLLTYLLDWRSMLHRDDTPWYPTMRLFRQTESDDWQGVLDRVSQALLQHHSSSPAVSSPSVAGI